MSEREDGKGAWSICEWRYGYESRRYFNSRESAIWAASASNDSGVECGSHAVLHVHRPDDSIDEEANALWKYSRRDGPAYPDDFDEIDPPAPTPTGGG